MPPKKKRAPGGGRKSQGEFSQLTSLFAVRMPDELREQLEAAAKNNRRSASQELLRRLDNSFGRDRDRDRDPPTRALCFLLSELAEKIRWPAKNEKTPWHRNPFLFRAFKIAVAKLLDELEPKGKIKSLAAVNRFADDLKQSEKLLGKETVLAATESLFKSWSAPDGAAEHAFRKVLFDLHVGQSPDEVKDRYSAVGVPLSDDLRNTLTETTIKPAERTWYGMHQAARDLGLTKHRERKS
jgi:hypothetical protein